MIISNNSQSRIQAPVFQKFLKVKGSNKKLENVKSNINKKVSEAITFISKKENKDKNILYVLTEEHADKFLDIISKSTVFFKELRTKPETFLKEKAKETAPSEVIKELIG